MALHDLPHADTSAKSNIQSMLASIDGRALAPAERAQLAERIAFELVAMANLGADREDRDRARMLARLMRDPRGQAFTTALTDRLFRSRDPRRVVDGVGHLTRTLGLPGFMAPHERLGLWSVRPLAPLAPRLLTHAIAQRVNQETRSVLLPAAPGILSKHVARRHAERVRLNVNQLGEALLGEGEAEVRVAKYEALARSGEVDALSVKVSSIGSQLNLLAFEDTVRTLAGRLSRIYRATLESPAGKRPIVMLDMEAYQDIELTFCAMERALADTSLDAVRAGIVLQAYLPDSNDWHERLLAWAQIRSQRGGERLRMRLVKGANLAQERVDSARMGVEVPIFADKRDVDANYKRMLERGTRPEHLAAVELGVASHNLFDVAYGLTLRAERRGGSAVGFELLEGMASAVQRALTALEVDVLLYAPICEDDQLNTGIAYLVRRLDENTSPDNFLSASFGMRPGDAAFERERTRFRAACARIDGLDTRPRRHRDPNQDRTQPPPPVARGPFVNEPDTDFSCRPNRDWIGAELATLRAADAPTLCAQIGGTLTQSADLRDGFDPSRPRCVPYRVALASPGDVERALACAAADADGFSALGAEARAHLLDRAAAALQRARGSLIACMVLDAGKRVVEADAEVSEAIDFARYYRSTYLTHLRAGEVDLRPRGVTLVTPPWNFPLAIPAGGVLAALMAGNRVILKPALETVLVAERLCRILWDAGISRTALQFVVCEDAVASALVRDARVDSVILTGATDTARLFQRLRPGLRLHAETGGKNALIVTAMADRDLAIRDAVHSAFGHAGQKCSAASLLILEAEVYDDPAFMHTLKDAVESLPVGSAWDPRNVVTPLIQPPGAALQRALTQLEPGESFLVAPRVSEDNPRLVSPAVKLGVRPQSFMHLTELFGPVLAVMRARDLTHALELAASTGYGLTAGISSLDEREQARFLAEMPAGNLYVNRSITGAIVERQPFGGIGKSGFGPGAKAGGPNYVLQLCHLTDAAPAPAARSPLDASLRAQVERLGEGLDAAGRDALARRATDYARASSDHFAKQHGSASLRGQDNLFRYQPCPGLVLRVAEDATVLDVASSCLAAWLVGARLELSIDGGFAGPKDAERWGHPVHEESVDALARRARDVQRIRVVGSREPGTGRINEATGAHIEASPVLGAGRYELLHYVREQSVSVDFHRYGNLGLRESGRPENPGGPTHV